MSQSRKQACIQRSTRVTNALLAMGEPVCGRNVRSTRRSGWLWVWAAVAGVAPLAVVVTRVPASDPGTSAVHSAERTMTALAALPATQQPELPTPRRLPVVPRTQPPVSVSAPARTAPTATAADTVGPLFGQGLLSAHGCTGSVVDSPGHDLILTAAHCVAGSGDGLLFVPGYAKGSMPHGVWTVQHAWADPAWIASQDEAHDYAVLQVRPNPFTPAENVEDVTGGLSLGVSPAAGITVQVTGYPVGLNDEPISCRTTFQVTDGNPGFSCGGFGAGTSGSPFIQRRGSVETVVGVIGGRHQGGCIQEVSYSSAFDRNVESLLQRAAAGEPSDVLPVPHDAGC